MANNFTPMGVEAVVLGLDNYVRNMNRMARANDEASGSLSGMQRISGQVGEALNTLGRGATTMIQVGDKIGAAFAQGELLAGMQQTRESFATMLEVIGANVDLLDELRDASLGTVSDQVLMSSTMTLLAGAGDELALQLANATPRLLEIAKAANRANPALGDTAFLYQSIATGVKRASPMILDNLGLTVKVGEANEAYAAQLGKTVEELTAEERAIALLNATLAAGDTLMAQVGGSTESATDDFARLTAQTENLKESLASMPIFGRTYVQWTADAAEGATNLIEGNSSLTGALGELESKVISGEITYDEYLNTIRALPDALEVLYIRFGKLSEAEVLNAQTAANVASETADADRVLQDYSGRIEGIPTMVRTQLWVDTTQAFKSLQGVLDFLTRIQAAATIRAAANVPITYGGGAPPVSRTEGFLTPDSQHGNIFRVGGLAGPDRNLVSMPVSRGEIITVTPPPSISNSSRSVTTGDININNGMDQYAFNKQMEEWLGA